MNLSVRIPVEDGDLAEMLETRHGHQTKVVRGAIITRPPVIDVGTGRIKLVPSFIDGYLLQIEAMEERDERTATIVCALSGRPLRGYVPRRPAEDTPHAFFAVGTGLVTVEARRHDDRMRVLRHIVYHRDGEAWIHTVRVGNDDVPVDDHYYAAARAAREKAACTDCTESHFIAER